MTAVQQSGRALNYVNSQTPELCMAAVQQDVYVVGCVKSQTPEICIAAVQQNSNALIYVKNPNTHDMRISAVHRYSRAL